MMENIREEHSLRDRLIEYKNILSKFDMKNSSSELSHTINEMARFCSSYKICSSTFEEMLQTDPILKLTCEKLHSLFSIFVFYREMQSAKTYAYTADQNQMENEFLRQRKSYETILQCEINTLTNFGVHLSKNSILNNDNSIVINKIAFIGSGPIPISSWIILNDYAPLADIYNIDMNEEANQLASIITKQILPLDVYNRMHFITQDITEKPLPSQVKSILNQCQLIYLAAFVSENELTKLNILTNIINQSNNQLDKKISQYFIIRSGEGLSQVLFPKINPQKIQTLQTNLHQEKEKKFLFEIKAVRHSPDFGMTHIIAKSQC